MSAVTLEMLEKLMNKMDLSKYLGVYPGFFLIP